MEEKPLLREMLAEAISAFCAQNGFGMPIGFIYCVAHISSDGEKIMTIGEEENQMTALSLGMASYLKKSFEMDAEFELSSWVNAMDEEDE